MSIAHFQPFNLDPTSVSGKRSFSMDMKETNDNYIAMIDVPGVPKEDCKLQVKNDVLTLSADYTRDKVGDEERFHWKERFEGHVTRSIKLPGHADTSAIKAKYSHGVLTVTIPKKKDDDAPIQNIEIL
mmetsp:Transcript_19234/g.31576  ORF Transcript_19234/g.31576 Transcript_19234/m.31576 type:complete len:128 (-) Transcript_19234:72-455(-)